MHNSGNIRIAHVINKLDVGGAQRLLSALVPFLKAGGNTVHVFTLNADGKAFSEVLRQHQVEVINLTAASSVYSPWHIFRLARHLGKYDLVHVHLFPAQYWVALASLLCKKCPVLVTTEHNTYNKRMSNRIFRPLERFIYSRYHGVVSISEETRTALSNWLGFHRERPIFPVIHNGIDTDHFSQAKAIPLREISTDLSASSRLLIQVARFNEQKDQATTIRAMQHLPPSFRLLLVGHGPQFEKHVRLVSQLGLGSRIQFLGSRDDVASLTKSAHIAVVSSHWEGFGLVALEAMAAGIPVIASAVEGLKGVVQDAGLTFPPGDHKELARLILRADANETMRKSIVESQFARVKVYSIQKMAAAHASLYTSLLKHEYD